MPEGSSTIVEEVLEKFFQELTQDEEIDKVVLSKLKDHFNKKPSITPAEIKDIVSALEDVE